MKYLRLFENREEEIHKICQEHVIKYYTINPDGSIDVDDDVTLSWKSLTELPIQFRRVSGSFNCGNNKLTTLKGAPKYVGGNFHCHNNNLTDLEHFPEYVNLMIFMGRNPIYSIADNFIYRKNRHKIIELFNFSGVIQGGQRVILNRLEYVFDAYGIDINDWVLRRMEIYNYTIIGR